MNPGNKKKEEPEERKLCDKCRAPATWWRTVRTSGYNAGSVWNIALCDACNAERIQPAAPATDSVGADSLGSETPVALDQSDVKGFKATLLRDALIRICAKWKEGMLDPGDIKFAEMAISGNPDLVECGECCGFGDIQTEDGTIICGFCQGTGSK